jgi:hypothetical protein
MEGKRGAMRVAFHLRRSMEEDAEVLRELIMI